ncbi:glycoside hydrolase family 30 protein [Anaerolactibacter massiliensis]|uniref:glycoside hydrolase family 30 protein n=1 Tax=Anaerolactibacter massiliensis TaxID=2044573 RepID=UPI000CF854F0|nr:glycoside hydrolase family 30 beta sandwich domain-containing protein [Anaerolactibacter massiliensis]
MQALFSKENGIGISMLRQTIGASDHCVAPYNFAPVSQADDLPDFDFSHELETIFPTVQDAIAVEGNRIKIIASAWSAPGWMKLNQSELGMYQNVRGTLLPAKYQAYANYLLKWIQNYENRGVDIYAITPNNEPDHASYDWPAMPMTHTEAQNLVANYIYPTLRNAGIDSKIICWDHSYTTTNYKDGSYPLEYFADAAAYRTTDGSAWHWYEGDEEVMSVVKKEYPDKELWFTEGSGGEWGFPKWKTAFLNQASSVINISRNWCKSIIYWNIALDENGGPDYYYDVNQGHDSTNRGLITITSDGTWDYNVDYYTLGHVSKFVDPGAYRIDSTSLDNNIETVAFQNPDNSIILVTANLLSEDQSVKICWGNQMFNYNLPSESMLTFKWSGTQSDGHATPIWFNNFENNDNYSAGNNAIVSSIESTANFGGTKGIKLVTSANGEPGTDSQCAVILPSSNNPVDASRYQYLTFSVKDEVNPTNCTVKVTFIDANGNVSTAWSHEKTVYDNWTRIWVPIGGSEGFNRTAIAEIRIGFYWQGEYDIDDLAFCFSYNDGLPSFNDGNLAINPSFEDDGSKVRNPKGWNFEGANPEATYLEKNDHSPSGRFHVVHYSADAHDCYTWQTIYNLENGTYVLQASVESGGGQTQNKIIATDFGGSEEMNVAIPVTSTWTQVEITGINVTNNKCTIAFYTQGNAGDWSCADNFILKKVSN